MYACMCVCMDVCVRVWQHNRATTATATAAATDNRNRTRKRLGETDKAPCARPPGFVRGGHFFGLPKGCQIHIPHKYLKHVQSRRSKCSKFGAHDCVTLLPNRGKWLTTYSRFHDLDLSDYKTLTQSDFLSFPFLAAFSFSSRQTNESFRQ